MNEPPECTATGPASFIVKVWRWAPSLPSLTAPMLPGFYAKCRPLALISTCCKRGCLPNRTVERPRASYACESRHTLLSLVSAFLAVRGCYPPVSTLWRQLAGFSGCGQPHLYGPSVAGRFLCLEAISCWRSTLLTCALSCRKPDRLCSLRFPACPFSSSPFPFYSALARPPQRLPPPMQLRSLVDDASFADAVTWTEDGTAIVIQDVDVFARRVLGSENNVFKTKNYSSFVRQLNMYGFSKVRKWVAQVHARRMAMPHCIFLSPFPVRFFGLTLECSTRSPFPRTIT